MKNYDERTVINQLCRLGCRYESQYHITAPKDLPLGIHALGKIDFLVNYKGYVFSRTAPKNAVSNSIKAKRHKKTNKNQYEEED